MNTTHHTTHINQILHAARPLVVLRRLRENVLHPPQLPITPPLIAHHFPSLVVTAHVHQLLEQIVSVLVHHQTLHLVAQRRVDRSHRRRALALQLPLQHATPLLLQRHVQHAALAATSASPPARARLRPRLLRPRAVNDPGRGLARRRRGVGEGVVGRRGLEGRVEGRRGLRTVEGRRRVQEGVGRAVREGVVGVVEGRLVGGEDGGARGVHGRRLVGAVRV